ncbi:hypothetical protein M5J15_06960 [Serratia symbiotica]|uniref:hypothetical protein n=1 Tax=Serratia symbiotica TaxID=138074 RepID=UPI002091AFB3|nr:hypothetical protein [Serratia symbiotica]MCX2957518.1 hypothetical protein [Serratia symbiotica]USS96568.1 hypothetical protein M5J15_06960 [Serratia symbiotica]
MSVYSGQIVSNPTVFAFAKGAGLMGEAGPEAIMPLKRGADGSLGVRAIGIPQQAAAAPNVYITIEGGGNVNTQADQGWEEFGKHRQADVQHRRPGKSEGHQPEFEARPAYLESAVRRWVYAGFR